MTKSDAKKYNDLKRGVFSEALTYAGLYQKQCKAFFTVTPSWRINLLKRSTCFTN